MSNSYNYPLLPTPDSPKVTVSVDGVDVQVPDKVNLIEALRTLGIETPHFCYHPDLPVAGNCRQCLVETDGPRGMQLVIGCYTPVRAGMKIATEKTSDKVRGSRKAVMEFELVNHPLDCPICDKAGECTLQENYMQAGKHESRLRDDIGKAYKGHPDHQFSDSKCQIRGGKHVDLGPTVVLDEERCILCDRCVRFMREVAGDEQLYIASRGDHAYLTVFPGSQLDHEYDLNVVDICPVGALTAKHFRFRKRVWLLQSVESIVPDDSLGANISIDHNEGRAWRITPRRNPDVNKSWISNASRLQYQRLNDNRLAAACVEGRDASLEQGLLAAVESLSGAKKIALVASGHRTIEDNTALLALAEALGKRAEVFGGSWLPVGKPDGIARSGDPVANRKGLELLGIRENLSDLVARAKEFDALVVLDNDLWSQDGAKATALAKIARRIVLTSWLDAAAQQATVALGILAWAEIRGTMVNCNGRVQMMQAAPIAPDARLEPAWRLLGRLRAALSPDRPAWSDVVDVWKEAASRVPAFAGMTYRTIGPMGQQIPTGQPAPQPA